MKIAFVKTTPHVLPASGVKIQAKTWQLGLIDQGHQVDLVNFWDDTDWTQYDIAFLFEYGGWLKDLVFLLQKFNVKIVLSPIIDANTNPFLFSLACKYLGCEKLRLSSKFHDLYLVKDLISKFYVRSEYEYEFIKRLGVEKERVDIIPLSYRIPVPERLETKENFCFHVSRLADKGKNVTNLILAAKKYNFNLYLAGGLKGDEEKEWLKNLIDEYDNIKYIGYLSDEELYSYYNKAKVFALPSTYEGVGMVALEAALCGCEIVITKNGGPKEYFKNMAELVNPYDVDEIGSSIVKLLSGKVSYQPELSQVIKKKFDLSTCMADLSKSLQSIL